jgi:putative sigma-54 modulation protein
VQILITGRHLGVTDAMKAYAREKVAKLERFFDRATSARVTMDVQHDSHVVEMQVDLVRGMSAVGKVEAPDMYAALDLVEQKVAMQLRRFNQRLKDHHRREGKPEEPARGAEVPDRTATYEDVIEDLRDGAPGPDSRARRPDVREGGHER